MIFDSNRTCKLVAKWRRTRCKDILAEILEASQSLVEAVVSQFDAEHRDDLIQESLLKVTYAIGFYDPMISTLYSYLSVVIRNACITYLRKISKEVLLPDDVEWPAEIHTEDDYEIMYHLVERNRERFSSLPVDIVDGASEDVYFAIRDGIYGKSRGSIAELMNGYALPRNVATVFYHSSMIYLRMMFVDKFPIVRVCGDREYTLLPELASIAGPTMYDKLLTVFSGTYVKIP